jgi:small multidrug resistance pump
MKWIYLFISIAAEITATTSLKESDGFTRFWPSVVTAVGYVITFYFLSLALREISVSVAYAIWSGVGIVALAFIAYFRFNQKLDLPAIIGILLIITGVIIINLFSKSISH